MMQSSFWARPGFLWVMSVVAPLAVVPAVVIQEYVATGVWGPDDAYDGGDADLVASEIAMIIGWFIVPPMFAALHLWRYRGGATMWPLIGRGWVSGVLSAISFPLTGLILLTAVVSIDRTEPETWPFAMWLVALAVYCQALRAAAVRRSLPDDMPSAEELTKVFG